MRSPTSGSPSGGDPNNHVASRTVRCPAKHCVHRQTGRRFLLRDLGSHNGTLVNELPVTDQLLAHRDTITVGQTVLQFLTRDDIVFESPPGPRLFRCPRFTWPARPPKLAPADLHALLRVKHACDSFHAMYRGRGSSAANLLESHLLSALILEVSPAARGAILFYEESLDEPSSLAIEERKGKSAVP